MTLRGFDGDLIPCIRVTDNAHAGIGGQDSFQALSRFRCPIRDDDLTSVL